MTIGEMWCNVDASRRNGTLKLDEFVLRVVQVVRFRRRSIRREAIDDGGRWYRVRRPTAAAVRRAAAGPHLRTAGRGLLLVRIGPRLLLAGGEDRVEDHSDEVDEAGNEEDGLPLLN